MEVEQQQQQAAQQSSRRKASLVKKQQQQSCFPNREASAAVILQLLVQQQIPGVLPPVCLLLHMDSHVEGMTTSASMHVRRQELLKKKMLQQTA